MQVVSQDFD